MNITFKSLDKLINIMLMPLELPWNHESYCPIAKKMPKKQILDIWNIVEFSV